ncbi:MAG: PriA 3primeBD protein [Patescibacteria group bacterium]|nr:PriA 3primeBD protein [Patescibacteria group bacterium]
MKLVTIIPFLKTLQIETLTYFSGKEVTLGDIVSAPVRNKEVDGIVINVEDVSGQKGDIKDADFNFKKITKVKGASIFLKSFLESSEYIKDYFVASTGQILNTLIPAILFANYDEILKEKIEDHKRSALAREKYAFQAPTEDRLVIYKTYIRESFAKKESVYLCFPTISEAKYFYDHLSKGIEDYSFFLHAGLPKKDFIKKYNKVVSEIHPVVIFSTPSFFFIPRNDFGTIIIERESSSSYVSSQKPYIDGRIFAEVLSYKQNVKMIYADSILRTETIWRVKSGELAEFRPLNFRLPEKEEEEVIDMRNQKNKDFQIISKKVFLKIRETIQNGGHMFLFTLRKGYATTTICNDCGATATEDGEPLILFEDRERGIRYFKTIKSKKIFNAERTCLACKSWNLVPLGIGTQKVYEEVLRIAKKEKVFLLDKIEAKNEKTARKIVKDFEETPGSVLVGTEMALFYLTKEIDNVAVVSFDSLFNIPHYNVYEKIIDLIVILNSFTKKSLLVQTRQPDEKILKHIQNRNLIQFYKDDVENRKQYKYPPFYTVIKVSYESNLKEKQDVVEYLKETYKDYGPIMNEVKTGPNKIKVMMILKIEREKWSNTALLIEGFQDKELLEKLRTLPSYWSIQINPSQLL